MEKGKKHQVCLSDGLQHWQKMVDEIRDAIKSNKPENITDNELWDIQKKRGTSGVLKFLIRLGHALFVSKTHKIVKIEDNDSNT